MTKKSDIFVVQYEISRFYFFDLGVVRALARQLSAPLIEKTFSYGEAFEHFIIMVPRPKDGFARVAQDVHGSHS